MKPEFREAIRAYCRELAPRPTEAADRIVALPDIRAVLFDIYGTLLISASGDVGANVGDHRAKAFQDVVALVESGDDVSGEAGVECFQAQILAMHEESRTAGIPYPEVDIVEVWRQTMRELCGWSDQQADYRRMAVEYEMRVNPTWPMPGVLPTLEALHQSGRVLGIVSNAQFFTPLLFPALVGKSLDELGFVDRLTYFSFEHGMAKPGLQLFEMAREEFALRDISAEQVLYVGNDMLNDVMASASVGFRTALFAGDARSLRLRESDGRVHGVEADIVVTALPQLIECLNS